MSLALPQPEALARASLLAVALLLLSACGPSPEEQRAAAEAAAQAREAKVAPTLALYREAKAKGDAALALASATVVMTDAPGGAAAAEVEANLESLREEAAAQAETKRLQGLWAYLSTLIDGEVTAQRSASMRNLKPEGSEEAVMAPPTVQLVLRNDPRWGQSTYLVIEDGVFDCGSPCAFQLRFDGGDPQRFAGEASSTGTHPALFINDDKRFIAALKDTKRLEVLPANGKGQALVFEVGGYDPERYRTGR